MLGGSLKTAREPGENPVDPSTSQTLHGILAYVGGVSGVNV